MTSEFDQNLSSILDTTFEAAPTQQEEKNLPVPIPQPAASPDVQEDFEFSRRNYQDLLAKGGIALDGILEVAKESQHPRAYEVAGTIMKNLADMTDKLMMLQKQRKDLQGAEESKAPTQVNVDKAVFVGSATDLLKKIKNGDN